VSIKSAEANRINLRGIRRFDAGGNNVELLPERAAVRDGRGALFLKKR
jgi:hypothetical protein